MQVLITEIVARPRRAKPEIHGEIKQRYQFMLTETASEELDRVAEELGITRSEVLERMIRGGGLELAKSYIFKDLDIDQ